MTIEILVGKDYPTNRHGLVRVLEIENSRKVLVKFHNTHFEKIVTAGSLRKGQVQDDTLAYHGSGAVMDLQGKFAGKRTKEYALWLAMIQRCYNPAAHLKRPRYEGCEVSTYFKLYSNFAEWCGSQVGFNIQGFDLDKDLLVKGNKLYSESTCVFIPKEINIALEKANKLRGDLPIGVSYNSQRGKYAAHMKVNGRSKSLGRYATVGEAFIAYKAAKERHLKALADKWKDQIDLRAYKALINYEVSIDD